MNKKNAFTINLAKLIDILGLPITLISTLWLKLITRLGFLNMRYSEKIFMFLGILPIRDHYYQPLVNPKKHLKKSLREERSLPGINFNVEGQLSMLEAFNYNEDINNISRKKTSSNLEYHFELGGFLSGDVEYLYNIIRHFKPKRIIEVGCGTSTLVIKRAIQDNQFKNPTYSCKQFCIEPFEQPWLEKTGCNIIRKKIEDVNINEFTKLNKGDIFFVDSSHIIRPQGDVLFEILQILPLLNSGVIIHFHDIFTPRDYLDKWVLDQHLLWNEQYVLEAFLSNNKDFTIIGALNYLRHNHREALAAKCPIFAEQLDREPGSIWIVKN